MQLLLIGLIFFLSAGLVFVFRYARKKDDFRYLIEPELRKFKLDFVTSLNPGRFETGPFKKFRIAFGKPQINMGTVEYEFTNYRKVTAKKKDGTSVLIWAKIESGPFKHGRVEFDPPLDEIE